MVIKMIDKLVHMRRFQSGLRRGLAAALSLALVLPILPTASVFAANTMLYPVKMATPEEFPHIEIEGNFVRDEFGFLTGYYEMGLRVRTPEKGSFMGLGVVLEYDTSILTPVDWSEAGANVTIKDVGYYGAQLPTQKLPGISSATAHSGIPKAAADAAALDDTTATTTTKALMSFVVNSYKQVAFPGASTDPDATTLAVVRFRVNKKAMEKLSISKDAAGNYKVKYGDKEVKDVDSLYQQMTKVSHDIAVRVMGFASDKDIKESESSKKLDVHMALDYMAGYEMASGSVYANEYYHVPAYNADDRETCPAAEEIIGDKTTPYKFDQRPKTENNRIMAVDPTVEDTATAWGAGKYSYISNLIVNTEPNYVVEDEDGNPIDNYITFPIVSKRSFIDQSDTLGNLTTIVYVDWDNTLLGTQVVPKNADIRQLVSDHVAENFIYHDDDPKTYGVNDLNEPMKKNPDDPEAVVSSLKRIDNYRGKYTANGPALEGTSDDTVVTDGGSYALTNKLDYVFLKRPMTHTTAFDGVKPDPDDAAYPGGVTDPGYIAALKEYNDAYEAWYWAKTEWSQQVDDAGKPVWDTERPYAYGWAECTVNNFEDVWTTLGRGELGSTEAATETDAKGATKGYSGAANGGYKKTDAASVTYVGDANFAFADLSKGFDKSTVFLKAVYEPGEGLLGAGYAYRMLKKPYYNKFNSKPANDGGAYMVSVTFERAALSDDLLLSGTARIREPVVRQDTTTDLRWEESTTPLVSHNLANPDWNETYNKKSKTTYTKLDVPNSEEILLEMSFSARQNKIDYFLRENYKSNFVAAGERTNTNSGRSFEDGQYTVDNYNYYAGDKMLVSAKYYAPTVYADREGTYGFVLFGTLNYLMEQATLYAKGDIDADEFYNIVLDAHADANLKDSSGNTIVDIDTTMEILKAAAEDAETHKGATDEADYWNADRDCAELTYHQLWYYLNSSEGLLDRDTADDADHKIKWCHLHADCAALQSGKPRDWKALITAAGEGSTAKIEQLKPDEIEDTFRLRQPDGGTGFASWTSSDFATTMVAAVDKLKDIGIAEADITWDQVQYVIDKGVADLSADEMNAYGAANYWWYDGKKVESFEDVKLAADAAHSDPHVKATLPDGRSVAGREAKLNQLKTVFDANTDVDSPTADWIKFTENLTMGQKGETGEDASKVNPFTSFNGDGDTTSFVAKLVDAIHETTTSATWTAIQAQILGEATPAADYWWHNGGVNITDLASLLRVASKGGTAWNSVSLDVFNKLELGFRADLAGAAITEDNFAAVKTRIAAYAGRSGADLTSGAWDDVQYYIINNAITADNRDAEKPYYWWFADGSREKTAMASFTPTGDKLENKADDLAKKLSEAYFKSAFNGYADDEVNWADLADTDLRDGRLVKGPKDGTDIADTAAYPGDFTLLSASGDLALLKNAMGKAFAGANGGTGKTTPGYVDDVLKPYTPFTWEALQGELLSGVSELWWKNDDSKGVDGPTAFAALQTALENYLDSFDFDAGTGDPDLLEALKGTFTEKTAGTMEFIDYDTWEVLGEDKVNYINDSWDEAITASDPDVLASSHTLTWEQIQVMIIFDSLFGGIAIVSADEAVEILSGEGIEAPSWGGETYSITPMMTMMSMGMLSPEGLLEQQAAEVKEIFAYLAEAVADDPALAAKLTGDQDFMADFAALAAAMGYAPKEQVPEEKVPEKTPDKTPEQSNGKDEYKLGKDTVIHPVDTAGTETGEQEQKQETTSVTTLEAEPVKQAEPAKKAEPAADAGAAETVKEAAVKKTPEKETPTQSGQTEETLTTNTNDQIPKTGQGDVSVTDTSPAGVDPPPDEGLPRIIGIVILKGLEKTTEGVHVA